MHFLETDQAHSDAFKMSLVQFVNAHYLKVRDQKILTYAYHNIRATVTNRPLLPPTKVSTSFFTHIRDSYVDPYKESMKKKGLSSNSRGISRKDQVAALMEEGITDKDEIAEKLKTHPSYVHRLMKQIQS